MGCATPTINKVRVYFYNGKALQINWWKFNNIQHVITGMNKYHTWNTLEVNLDSILCVLASHIIVDLQNR